VEDTSISVVNHLLAEILHLDVRLESYRQERQDAVE
jgi:hypothetical protein